MLRWVIPIVLAGSALAQQIRLVDEPMAAFDGVDQTIEPMPGVPADPDIAVGEEFIIQVVNGVMYWRARSNMGVTDSMMLNSFLGLQRQPMSFGTDPRIIFDPVENRFVATAYGIVPGEFGRQIVVAVSPDEATMAGADDPLTGWTHFSLQGFWQQTGEFTHPCATGDGVIGGMSVDQPLLGMSEGAWIISAFVAPLIPDNPADSVIYAINKQSLDVAGPMFASDIFRDGNGEPMGCISGTRGIGLPRPVKNGPTAILIGVKPGPVIPADFTALTLYSIADPFNTRKTSTAQLDIGALPDAPPCAPTSGFPRQAPLHALDARIQSAAWTDDGTLWVTLATNSPVNLGGVEEGGLVDRAVIKWYQIALNGWPEIDAQPTIAAQGSIISPTSTSGQVVHNFFPTAAVNDAGDLAIVHARSSERETASIRAWGRFANGIVPAPLSAKVSPVNVTPDQLFLGTCARWGDYFDVELDPLDDTFWGTGMYMKSATPKVWGTWIFHFEMIEP